MSLDIRTIGLEAYLNATWGKHNHNDYEVFKKLVDSQEKTEEIARKFAVSRRTVFNWLDIYRGENNV